MFWGKGDSARLTDEERRTLDELRRLVETNHIIALSPEQVDLALAALRLYGGFSAATGVFAGARNTFLWIGSMLLIWWSIQDWAILFIRRAVAE
jgi:hypothetical protein